MEFCAALQPTSDEENDELEYFPPCLPACLLNSMESKRV
jgi:hypothetical protein